MPKIGRFGPRPRGMTRTLLLTTALGGSLLASPAFAFVVDCGPVPAGGGTVTCTTADNPYPSGVNYTTPEDLTVVLNNGVDIHRTNAFGTNDAISIVDNGVASNVTITGANANVAAEGAMRDGVYVYHTASGVTGQTNITLDHVVGLYDGISVVGGGDVDIHTQSVTGDSYGIKVSGLSTGAGATIHGGDVSTSGGSAIRVSGGAGGDVHVYADSAISPFSTAVDARVTGAGNVSVDVGYVYGRSVGVFAGSVSGSVTITADHVKSRGDGIFASTYGGGGASITAGVVDSKFSTALGALANNGGNLDVTVNAGGHAYGDSHNAAVFGEVDNAAGGVTITTTGATVKNSGDGGRGIAAFTEDGDILINAGSVRTTSAAAYSGYTADAIYADAHGTGSVTVNLGPGSVSTVADYALGVFARTVDSTNGPVTITQDASATVVTHGYEAVGIGVAVVGGSHAPVVIDAAGSVTTFGNGSSSGFGGASAIAVNDLGSGGPITITSGQTRTHGDYSVGIAAFGKGDVTVTSASAQTFGYASPGIVANAIGDATVTAGVVATQGDLSPGVYAIAWGGEATVTVTGSVTTAGGAAQGIYAAGHYGATVKNQGAIHTSGAESNGIDAQSYRGDVVVVSQTVVADQSKGIHAYSDYGDVHVNAANTTTHGAGAVKAIDASSIYGNVTVYGGVVSAVDSATSTGVKARSGYGDVAVTVHQVSAGQTGVNVQSYGGSVGVTVTPGGQVTVTGDNGAGVNALALGPGDVTIVATGATVSTSGFNSQGLFALAFGAGTASVSGGTVTTFGDSSAGVTAVSAYGVASASAESVSTSGAQSQGLTASALGAATVSGGTVITLGDYSVGAIAQSTNDAASVTVHSVSTSGSSSPALIAITGGAGGATVSGGTVTTAGDDSPGVIALSYGGAGGGVDVSVQSVSTTGDYSSGVNAKGPGAVNVTAGTVSTKGYGSDGVSALSYGGAVTVTSTSVTTVGAEARGIAARAHPGGSVSITAGTVSTAGDGSTGVYGYASNGDVSITSSSVSTQGGYTDHSAAGIVALAGVDNTYAITGSGSVTIKSGVVRTSGYEAAGISATANGSVTITSADLATTGFQSRGIDAFAYGSGSVSVTSGKLSTSGTYSHGITAVADGDGNVSVTSDDLSTSGVYAAGINAVAYGAGAVSVTSGKLSVTGPYSEGMFVASTSGAIKVSATDTLVSQGRDAIDVFSDTGDITGTVGTLKSANGGILSISNGSTQTWTLGTVSTGRFGISAINSPGHSTTLNLTNVSSGTYAAMASDGEATINIASGGMVAGGLTFGVGFQDVDSGVLNNAGTLHADDDLAVFASSSSGPIRINNTGVVRGTVVLGDAGNIFNNAAGGEFTSTGSSDFGGGTNLFANAGTVDFAPNLAPIAVTFTGVGQFNNSGGLIDLRGRGAGDLLSLPGGFAASGDSRLAVDVFLGGPGSASDVLRINGAVSGTTSLIVNDTNAGGPGALVPDGIVVVDASAGSISPGAFTLANGPINKGVFAYDLYLEGKQEVIASRWSPLVFQTPFLETALENLFNDSLGNLDDRLGELRTQIIGANAPTVQLAALASDASGPLPGGQAKDNGVWVRLAAGQDNRKASRSQTVLGVTTTDNLDFDQSHVAVQGGVDHAFQGGGGTWLMGASLGYLDSSGNFLKGGEFGFTGPTASLYAEYIKGGLYASATLKADWLKLKYRTMAGEVQPSTHTYGGAVSMGYRWQSQGWFAEPEGSLSYGVGKIDAFTLGGGTFNFQDGETLRGRAVMNLGQSFRVNHGRAILEPTVTAGIDKEFLGGNAVDITAGPSVRVGDGAKQAWGEFGGGVRLIDPGSGLSAFVQGKYEGVSKVTSGFGFNAGVRFTF